MAKIGVVSIAIIITSIITLILGVVLAVKVSALTKIVPEQPTIQKLKVSVTPENSQIGTIFFIKAQTNEIKETQNLELLIQNKNYAATLQLFDDGKHLDEKANDGIYSGTFDSTKMSIGRYEITNQEETLASFQITNPGCEKILGPGGEEKIKFMILPYGYQDLEEFKQDAEKLLTQKNSLLTMEPFKTQKQEIAFYTAKPQVDLECKVGCMNISTIVCCNNQKVMQAANLILAHELGHSFADLADEYVYQDYFGSYSVGEVKESNCAQEGCEKWKHITQGCYKGCTYQNMYRSAQKNSIMYDLYPEFNQVCIEQIKKIIQNYKQNKEVQQTKKSYLINMEYQGEKVDIKEVSIKPVKSGNDYRKSEYSATITNSKGEKIFSTNMYFPKKIYPIPGTNSTPIEINQGEFSIIMPYQETAKDLTIYKQEKPIATKNLMMYSKTCGDNKCQETENHLNCPVDCEIKDNFCQLSMCDPDCESQKECQTKTKLKIILPFILIFGSVIIIFMTIFLGFIKTEQ